MVVSIFSIFFRFSFEKMSSNQQRVRYFLVQADGTPFSDSTVSSVLVSSSAIVDDLRKKVKKDNADGLLKGISATSLKVFKVYKGEEHAENELLDEEAPVSHAVLKGKNELKGLGLGVKRIYFVLVG